jgi:hypothetical protein
VTIVLSDPCENPTITTPDNSSEIYVITDSEGRYYLAPEFSVEPDFCPYEITVTVDSDEIEVDYDPETQELIVDDITDNLDPANPDDDGSTEHDYTIETTITVTADDGSTTSDTVTTTVTVKDPCVEPDYVAI